MTANERSFNARAQLYTRAINRNGGRGDPPQCIAANHFHRCSAKSLLFFFFLSLSLFFVNSPGGNRNICLKTLHGGKENKGGFKALLQGMFLGET